MALSTIPLLDRVDADDGGSLSSVSAVDDTKTTQEIIEGAANHNNMNASIAILTDEIILISTTTNCETPPAKIKVGSSSKNEKKKSHLDTPGLPAPWISMQTKGRLILLILAMGYGSLNISMRLVLGRPDPPNPSVSSTIQGWFAVLCFLPLLWKKRKGHENESKNAHLQNKDSPSFLRFALELAFIDFGTQALITTSLEGTQGARASFLVQMSVVFTPLLSVIFGKQRIEKLVWLSCFLALAGLFVLSYVEVGKGADDEDLFDGSRGLMNTWTLNQGDWCCLLAAMCWSFYIHRMSKYGDMFDETETQFVKNTAVATCYTLWMTISFLRQRFFSNYRDGSVEQQFLWSGWRDPIVWMILFYTALGPCTLADVCQQKAQASVTATETNVLLSLEPVFTTFLGFLVLEEIPSRQELCGGFLIMMGSITATRGAPSSSR